MNTITVQIREVYGSPKVYPVCAKAKQFAALVGTKTLTLDALTKISALGYTVMLDGDKYELGKSAYDGSTVLVDKDTPFCCDPRTETFWSM